MMTDGQIKPQRSGNISEWNFTRNTDPTFYVCPNQKCFVNATLKPKVIIAEAQYSIICNFKRHLLYIHLCNQ